VAGIGARPTEPSTEPPVAVTLTRPDAEALLPLLTALLMQLRTALAPEADAHPTENLEPR